MTCTRVVLGLGYPGVSRVIDIAFGPVQSVRFKNTRNFVLLVVTVFDQNPSSGGQVFSGARSNNTKSVQTLGAGMQRAYGLTGEVTLLQTSFVTPDVRGVRDDQIETIAG